MAPRPARKTKNPFFQEGILMGNKLSSFATICGGFLILLGLSFLPAAISNKDQAILGAGICAIAFGAMSIAAGLYAKARLLQNTPAAAGKSRPEPIRGGCDLCGTNSPVIHCRVHLLHICGDCVGEHYDFRSCVYIPSTRRSAPAKAQARTARAGRS
jgi:hypothetical protein